MSFVKPRPCCYFDLILDKSVALLLTLGLIIALTLMYMKPKTKHFGFILNAYLNIIPEHTYINTSKYVWTNPFKHRHTMDHRTP